MALQCTINGTPYEMTRSFYIQEQSGNKTQSEVQVLVESQPTPVAGDIIEIKDGLTTLFWGMCGIPRSPKFSTGHEDRIYTITCGNANSILSNRIINVAYQNKTVSQIVNQLYTDYIAEENITKGTISNIPLTMQVYTAGDFILQNALNELAELVGATWQVTNDKTFDFIVEEDFPQFPTTIDSSFLLGTDLQHTTKDYKTRTVQYISNAKDTTNPQTDTFTYDGNTNDFTVGFPLAVKPNIYRNGVQVNPIQIGVAGLDTGMVFYFSYDSPVVTYDDSTAVLVVGDTIAIEYVGLFPIRISLSNAEKIAEIAALTGTSGKREQVRISSDIVTSDDAYTVAQQLLDKYSEATGEVSLWFLTEQLYDAGFQLSDTDVLTQVTFDLPQFGIVGDFVITERKLEPYKADLSNFEQKLKVTIKLKNRDFLQSYGEIFSNIKAGLTKLSVRDSDTVIQGVSVDEVMILAEDVIAGLSWVWYPTESLVLGTQFVPCDFGDEVYPS